MHTFIIFVCLFVVVDFYLIPTNLFLATVKQIWLLENLSWGAKWLVAKNV